MAKKTKISPEKAREMLHNPPHGIPLTKKQRGLFGHIANANLGKEIPNYNNSNVSLPQGFVGEGYSNIPRNYSPAWGGSFQMGGMLSGANGFMYVREGAPSNGKYTKKTKPSAQNGTDLYPVESWRKQGILSADSLQRGTMYKIPYLDQKKLYNIPIPHNVNPNDQGYLTTSPGGIDPNILAKKKKITSSPAYDISGNIASINHPQGSNISNFNQGGEVSSYYINGLDFKTKGMQDGGQLSSVEKLSLLKERNKKRDSVNVSLTNQYPKDYNKVNLGMLNYFQNEPKKYQNLMKKAKGGVIKDDMGYWNPKNHGKVVEINSPNITMQGVSEPLLGIDNTGNHQMMYPGNNYSFSGSKVTEFPIDEITKGSKQDKGQLKKLRQLTDFSNNNNMEQAESGIHINPKNKGKFNALKKKTGKSTEELTHSKNPLTRKRAIFAQNASHWKHENGGLISYQEGGMPFSMNDISPEGSTKIDLNQNSLQPYGQYVGQQNINQGMEGRQSSNAYNKIGNNSYSIGQGIGAIGQGLQGQGMDNGPSASQRAVGQFGPIGGLISQASQIGTSFTKNNTSVGASALDTTVFDPAGSTWLNKDLSAEDRVLGGLFQPYGAIVASKAKKNKKKQAEELNNLVQRASKSVDIDSNKSKRYVRPEDIPTQPSQMFPAQGVGTNYLSGRDGLHIGGEIQNTYAPNTLYNDLGYEPLNDSNKVKNFRAGGHLSDLNYIAPSKEALQTYALGGELKVHGNGYAENISTNPYLPDGGDTVMFRGKSHENGGIPISYGKNPVEVEGGEPAVKLQDGGTGEDNLVVFGNMKIPNYGVNELGDKNAKNKKFKNYIADLSKKEDRQNKTIDKGLRLVDETEGYNAFDQLKMNSGELLMKGGDMKLKEIAQKKQIAANVQSAILDTAKEYNIDSDALSRGKVKKAKHGAKMTYAQDGMEASMFGDYFKKISKYISPKDTTDYIDKFNYSKVKDNPNVLKKSSINEVPVGSEDFNKSFAKARSAKVPTFKFKGKEYTTDLAPSFKEDFVGVKGNTQVGGPPDAPYIPSYPATGDVGLRPQHEIDGHGDVSKPRGKEFDWMTAAGQIWPYFRPTNQIPIDPNQFTGEYYALSHNTLEPVQAQRYSPLLDQPYDISLQDQMNANQSDFNSIQRLAQNNPAALSVLAGQKYGANSSVLGEQFRLNQANKANIYGKNRDILNDAQLKNLAILDQQYVRQSQAKSNTKAIAQTALSSIADKIQQNKLENRTLGVYENLYNYRYDNQGRAINLNSPYNFNIPQVGSTIEQKKKARNGSIVKAMKNL